MTRRLIAAAVAVLLAIAAAALVIQYASQADDRAMAQLDTAEVFVVTAEIPEGTPSSEIRDFLKVQELPVAAIVPGGVSSLDDLDGLVTATTLLEGEQLLTSRFTTVEELQESSGVEVPEGFHQVTIALTVDRVVGGYLQAGDTAGIFVNTNDEKTHLVQHKVLVTRVQNGVETVTHEDGSTTTQPAADTVMVTFAVSAADAEVIVHAAEFHAIWLSIEPDDAPESGTTIVDREGLF